MIDKLNNKGKMYASLQRVTGPRLPCSIPDLGPWWRVVPRTSYSILSSLLVNSQIFCHNFSYNVPTKIGEYFGKCLMTELTLYTALWGVEVPHSTIGTNPP